MLNKYNKYRRYNNIVNYMYGLGVHIGSSYLLQYSEINRYLLGVRKGYHLFDINKTILLLKRACFFLFNLLKNQIGNIYYSYNDVKYLSWGNLYILRNQLILKRNSIYSFSLFKNVGGNFTNYKACFLELLWILLRGSFKRWYSKSIRLGKYKNKKKIFKKFTFLKIFFLFLKKSYKEKKIDIHNLNIYWRCIIFLKNLSNFCYIPDCLISLGSYKKIDPAIFEFKKLRIPVIGIVECGDYLKSLTYLIPSNSSSFIVSFFFFLVFKYTSLKARFVVFKKKKKIIVGSTTNLKKKQFFWVNKNKLKITKNRH